MSFWSGVSRHAIFPTHDRMKRVGLLPSTFTGFSNSHSVFHFRLRLHLTLMVFALGVCAPQQNLDQLTYQSPNQTVIQIDWARSHHYGS